MSSHGRTAGIGLQTTSIGRKSVRGAASVVNSPTVEPITLAEFKLAARVTNTSEDLLIANILIPGARSKYELDTRRQVVTATYDFFLRDFPSARSGEDSVIEIPKPPLASVTSINYFNTDGVLTLLATSVFDSDTNTEPGTVFPKPNQEWPVIETDRLRNGVEIRFVAGVVAASVDPIDKQAIMMLALHWFENREAVVIDQRIATEIVPIGWSSIVESRTIIEVA